MKSVELQIAVPRTSDAGRIQHDQQHRPIIDQNLLSGQIVKESELDRQRSTGIDESAHNTTIRREGNGSSPNQEQNQRQAHAEGKSDELGKEHLAEHPYKGRHIDFSL